METNSDQVDFSNLTVSSAIVLDKDADETEKKIREVIKENIKVSADFGKDEDGDGELGESEDDDSDEEDAQEAEEEES